jgi:hypothetical protein
MNVIASPPPADSSQRQQKALFQQPHRHLFDYYVEVIIQEWIETAKELKRPIPQPKGKLMYA